MKITKGASRKVIKEAHKLFILIFKVINDAEGACYEGPQRENLKDNGV